MRPVGCQPWLRVRLPAAAAHPPPGAPFFFPPRQVIKLDVDNSPVELAFMEAIRGDTQLQGLIAEMFFEQHYKHKCGWGLGQRAGGSWSMAAARLLLAACAAG